MADLPTPINRSEKYLNAAASGSTEGLPAPITREEQYLDYIAEHGGGGGGTTVVANPEEEATDSLTKVQIEETVYSVSSGTSDYENLDNLPQINSNTLTGNSSGADLGLVDAVQGKGLSENDFTDTLKGKLDGIAANAEVNVQTDWNESDDSADDYLKNKPTLGTAAAKDSTNEVTTGSTDLVESGAVKSAIDALPEPMIFKGSLGTGGTITTLPTAAAANKGYTYKVITDGTYDGKAAKDGDAFVSDGTTWVLFPSGDEPSGTVTNVATGAGLTGGPVTSSGTIKVKLKSETLSALTSTEKGSTANREYAVGLDANGDLAVNIPLGDLAFKSSASGSFTPSGSVSQPTTTAQTTSGTVNSITAVGTLPSFSYDSSTETLTFSAGTLPTKGSDTSVLTGITSLSTSQPTFTGTAGTVTVS